jgi:hypothetical protein
MKKYKFLKYFIVFVITYVLNGLMCWIVSDMGFIESFIWFETLIVTFVLSIVPLTVVYLMEENDFEDLINYLTDENENEK